MRIDHSLSCLDDLWQTMAVYSGAMAVIWFTIPLTYGAILFRNFHRTKIKINQDEKKYDWFRFLFESYRPEVCNNAQGCALASPKSL